MWEKVQLGCSNLLLAGTLHDVYVVRSTTNLPPREMARRRGGLSAQCRAE